VPFTRLGETISLRTIDPDVALRIIIAQSSLIFGEECRPNDRSIVYRYSEVHVVRESR